MIPLQSLLRGSAVVWMFETIKIAINVVVSSNKKFNLFIYNSFI